MFIAKRRYERLKADPDTYCFLLSDKQGDPRFRLVNRNETLGGPKDYKSPKVEELLLQLGAFNYDDEAS